MFAEVNGVRIHYEVAGTEGPRVALLHGWGCSTELMKPVADGLRSSYRTLTLDFPGHGSSGKPPEPWGVPEYADCLLRLLRQENFLPCALVAHSFGCRVSAWAAAENPDLFTRLVLTGAAGLKKQPTEAERRRSEAYRKQKMIASRIGTLPGLSGLSGKIQEHLIQKYGSADYKALDPDMRETFNRVIRQDLRETYSRIRQSTLLIWGENDTETPLWMGQEIEQLIPDAGLVIFEGRSHFAYLEETQRFLTILKSFL